MAVHPRILPTDPDERIWDAIGGTRRDAQRLDRGSAAAPQRGSADNVTGFSGVTSSPVQTVDLVSVTVNVPVVESMVLFWWRGKIQATSATQQWNVHLYEATDFSTMPFLYSYYGFTSLLNVGSIVPSDGTGSPLSGSWHFGASVNPYAFADGISPADPTAGDRTYTLRGKPAASGGGGTANYTDFHLRVVVL